MILPKNIETLGLEGCPYCGKIETDDDVAAVCSGNYHWPKRAASRFNYFRFGKDWYVIKGRDVEKLLSLVVIDEGMSIQGAMDIPAPTRIDNQTDLIALLQKRGVTDEELSKHFRMSHMRGRVFKQLVKGK